MTLNITSLKHPKIQRKIRRAIWLARLEATKKRIDNQATDWVRGWQYVTNRKGHNIMRVDWNIDKDGTERLVVWGPYYHQITKMVEAVLYSEKKDD